MPQWFKDLFIEWVANRLERWIPLVGAGVIWMLNKFGVRLMDAFLATSLVVLIGIAIYATGYVRSTSDSVRELVETQAGATTDTIRDLMRDWILNRGLAVQNVNDANISISG